MRINEFAGLQRGDKIEVKVGYATPRLAAFQVWQVCSEPHDGNTMVDAIGPDGVTVRGIYFRDVLRRA